MDERERHLLDAVAGVQLAMNVVLNVLLQQQSSDPSLSEHLAAAFEQVKSSALGSLSSDYKIHALDEAAAAFLQAATKQD